MKKISKIAVGGRWAIYGGAGALLLSGLALAWEPGMEAPAWTAALQALARQAHGALAMLALLGLGALAGHVSTGWTRRKNLVAAGVLLAVLGGLIVSAWLLYYASPGALRDGASVAHAWLGYALVPVLVAHVVRGRASS
jgi:hypothetical protein